MNTSPDLTLSTTALPPSSLINRAWRIVGTGLSFTLFGLGGLLLGLLVFPTLRLVTPKAHLQQRFQYFNHLAFRFFVGFMARVGVMSYSISGLDQLQKPGQLIIANHPTLIDVVLLIANLPHTNCVVKAPLFNNPFTRGPVRAAGYVANVDTAGLIERCKAVLDAGESLLVFPEGTRTTLGLRSKLRRGTANIALRTGKPLLPVIIRCEPSTLTKGLPWYSIPARRAHLTIEVDAPIEVEPFLRNTANPTRAARQLTAYIEDYLWQRTLGPSTESGSRFIDQTHAPSTRVLPSALN